MRTVSVSSDILVDFDTLFDDAAWLNSRQIAIVSCIVAVKEMRDEGVVVTL